MFLYCVDTSTSTYIRDFSRQFLDIRKVASNVNRKLKELILPSDDDDTDTDLNDQIQVNFITGSLDNKPLSTSPKLSPKSSPTRSRKQATPTKTTKVSSPKQSDSSVGVTMPTKQAPPTQAVPNDKGGVDESGSGYRPRAGANVFDETGEGGAIRFSLLTVLGVLMPHMSFTEQETKLETLRWLLWLHDKLPKRVSWIPSATCHSLSLSL